MFSRRDRVELSVLGLVLLAWGLLVAPVLHSFAHAHGHEHVHASAQNLEHHAVAFVDAPPQVELQAEWLLVSRERPPAPVAPQLVATRRVEQSQAP